MHLNQRLEVQRSALKAQNVVVAAAGLKHAAKAPPQSFLYRCSFTLSFFLPARGGQKTLEETLSRAGGLADVVKMLEAELGSARGEIQVGILKNRFQQLSSI